MEALKQGGSAADAVTPTAHSGLVNDGHFTAIESLSIQSPALMIQPDDQTSTDVVGSGKCRSANLNSPVSQGRVRIPVGRPGYRVTSIRRRFSFQRREVVCWRERRSEKLRTTSIVLIAARRAAEFHARETSRAGQVSE